MSGTVSDEKGQPLKSATVFISGSEKITPTDDNGKFAFFKMDAGTFQLSVTMLGYFASTLNIIIKESVIDINIALKAKSIVLNEVVIGADNNWESYYKVFKGQFLGTSANAMDCEILNPRIINLNYDKNKGLLTADADKFLIIENKRLGYRIRYLLKDFAYNAVTNTAIYDGDTNFEQLAGTKSMQKRWAKNRVRTYKGSFMHFLRSVYRNTSLKEGFITNSLYKYFVKSNKYNDVPMVSIDTRPVKFDTLVTVIDTSFISLKVNPIYIVYDPKKATAIKNNDVYPIKKEFKLTDEGSIIKLPFNEAVIDRKGSYTNYRAFFIHGNLARKRIGDQLPFQYQPPVMN